MEFKVAQLEMHWLFKPKNLCSILILYAFFSQLKIFHRCMTTLPISMMVSKYVKKRKKNTTVLSLVLSIILIPGGKWPLSMTFLTKDHKAHLTSFSNFWYDCRIVLHKTDYLPFSVVLRPEFQIWILLITLSFA